MSRQRRNRPYHLFCLLPLLSCQLVGCGSGTTDYQELGAGGKSGGGADAGGASAGGLDAGGTTNDGTVADFPALHVDGNKIKNDDGDDVILRGIATIDIGSTQHYEGGIIEMLERITNRKDAQGSSPGFYPTVVRLAIYPSDSTDTDSPFTYEPGSDTFYTTLLRPAVNHLKRRGAYAIIDWHYIGDTDQHRETTAEFWAYMAPKFAKDSNVIFELFNEPVNRSSRWPGVKADMQTWVDIVREGAPDNLVLVGTPNWCQQLAPTSTDPVVGDNLAYVAHIYPMHWRMADVLSGVEQANAVHPVFLTEWGYEQGAHAIVDGTQASYGDPFKAWVEAQGMSFTAWCASASWYSRMFDAEYNLLVGAGYMGGFAKDWLYEKRNDRSPFPER